MAKRVFDVYNAFVGATQVVGAAQFEVTQGFDFITANDDGFVALPARDRNTYRAAATLRCGEADSFGAVLALQEAADTLTLLAEGKEVGTSNSHKITFNRAKLVSAGLSWRKGEYAAATFNFRNSAASASNTPDDEVAITSLAATITHATRRRMLTVVSATFTGDDASSVVPLSVTGLELNVDGQGAETAGDVDFGYTYEVNGYAVTGRLTYQDQTIATAQTPGQRAILNTKGKLDIVYRQQGGSVDSALATKTLTLQRIVFGEDISGYSARQFGQNQVTFGLYAQEDTTNYALATGTNKLIAVA